MWRRLNQFEEVLFLIPFLVYALLTRTYFSVRCTKCRKWLFSYGDCHVGLCEKCLIKEAVSNPVELQAHREKTAKSYAGYGEGHIYRTVTTRVGLGRVIDVGCGWGGCLTRLNYQGRRLYGIDLAASGLKKAEELTQSVQYCAADACYIPFKSDTFDYLICTETLEHIDTDDAVQECYRILKPGGTALFTVPSGRGIAGKTAYHVRFFTFASFSCLLENAGFQITSGRSFGLYIPILTRLAGVLSVALGKRLPLCDPLNLPVPEWLAVNCFIECKKA